LQWSQPPQGSLMGSARLTLLLPPRLLLGRRSIDSPSAAPSCG